MTKFQSGKTYVTRSIGDHDCIVSIVVMSRTDKTIQAATDRGVKTLRIREFEGVEEVKPWGNYSMAPIVSADRVATSR